MRTLIIDYGSGNLRSAAKAFERARSEAGLTGDIIVSSDPAELTTASHIVLPGVGAYGDCLSGIQSVQGLYETIQEQVLEKQKWFLGICVGMQLMLSRGFEHGEHTGFGWIEGDVVKLGDGQWGMGNGASSRTREPSASVASPHASAVARSGGNLKIPHMGWNELTIRSASPLLNGIEPGSHAYFVHSYHARCTHQNDILATTDYGSEVTAVIGRDNLFGTQFHPEKSQETGLKLIRNFLAL